MAPLQAGYARRARRPQPPGDPEGTRSAARAAGPALSAADEAGLGWAVAAGVAAQERLCAGAGAVAGAAGAGAGAAELEAVVAEGERAAAALIEANLWLVEAVARRYRGRRVAEGDLIQEGVVGLIRAVHKFDPSRGRLSTYAIWWIRQSMSVAVTTDSHTIRLPQHAAQFRARVRRIESSLQAQWYRAPSADEVAAVLEVPPDQVRRILRYQVDPMSMSREVGRDGSATLVDLVEDHDAHCPVDEAVLALMPAAVEPLLAVLGPREREVVRMRYGLGGGPTQTLAEIAAKLGVTRQRVGQIEAEALGKMRRPGSRSVHARELLSA